MNLMFRKNFQENKSNSFGKGNRKAGPRANANKRTGARDSSYAYQGMDEQNHQLRTHIFFAPTRSSYSFTSDYEGLSTASKYYCLFETKIKFSLQNQNVDQF